MLHKLRFEGYIPDESLAMNSRNDNAPSGLPQREAASGFKGDALLGS